MTIKERKHDYKPGDTLLYREGALYFLVKCLKNESDAKWYRYSLEIIEVLQDPFNLSKYISVGTVFNVSNKVGFPSYVWHLRDPKREEEFITRLRNKRDKTIPKP